jgi:uncharacterized membrane protein
MEQTAVEQLEEYLGLSLGKDRMRLLVNEFTKAKELEKRQIIDAFSTGTTYQIDSELEAIFNGIVYYEETFKTEEQ